MGPALQPSRPRWSPDGTKITFSSNGAHRAGETSNVYVVDPDGGHLRQLTDASGRDQAWAPDWGPEAPYIVFANYSNKTNHQGLAIIDGKGTPICDLLRGADGIIYGDPDWGL